MKQDDLKARYGASEHGNFWIEDTIGVPHPYCIGARHVTHASKHFNGMLTQECIASGEKIGIKCESCKGKLSYKEHETALLVACQEAMHDNGVPHPELQAYLLKVKPLCEEDRYVGFAFLDKRKKEFIDDAREEPTNG